MSISLVLIAGHIHHDTHNRLQGYCFIQSPGPTIAQSVVNKMGHVNRDDSDIEEELHEELLLGSLNMTSIAGAISH